MQDLTDAFVELIRRTATDLAPDMESSLAEAREQEEPGSAAEGALDTILQNVALAREKSTPICQDTGTPIFEVYYPLGWSTRKLADQIRTACATATAQAYLRPNAVDSLTGENSGDNTGIDFPTMHFHEWENDFVKVDLMLKGGGCENVGAQYAIPDARLKAGRDLEGVRRVALDAVQQAQGKGCAPGVLGIAVGGDRGTGYTRSKIQLFREIGDQSPNPELAELEQTIKDQANELGIGPMGFGGRTTILDVQMDVMHRLPASYFVSVSYMCWANRRRSMLVRPKEREGAMPGWEVIYQ
ncbi:MAG: fumarate hydratase [Chloroflexota bacterium]|nr:fumarate hydratase [Chloroflexota bacterium]